MDSFSDSFYNSFTFRGYTYQRAIRSFWDDVDPGPYNPNTSKALAYHVCGPHFGFKWEVDTTIRGQVYKTDHYSYHTLLDTCRAIRSLVDDTGEPIHVSIRKTALNRGQRVTLISDSFDVVKDEG